jgi:hypothetical protein
MNRCIFLFFLPVFSLWSIYACAQADTTIPADEFDYSLFTDAAGVKRYATQKVINQSPTRIVSIGYEYHHLFQMNQVPQDAVATPSDYTIQNMSGFRAQVNLPVISNDKFIWQVGASYWGSAFAFKQKPSSVFETALQKNGLHTLGLQSTFFKPLSEKNWLIVQVSGDLNTSVRKLSEVSANALTFSGTAIYGWKYSEKNMFGVGIARTYRAGALLHLPVIFWNKTFNDHYGMELLLPARGYIRRNFSTTSMLQLGYEIEGNQFQLANAGKNGDLFLQRGELKPRIMWDQKIAGFIWLNVQAGLRYNWRFDVVKTAGSRTEADRFYQGNLTNPLYFSFSLNFVSP